MAYKYVKEQVNIFKNITIGKVHTKFNTADQLTKLLDRTALEFHVIKLFNDRRDRFDNIQLAADTIVTLQ